MMTTLISTTILAIVRTGPVSRFSPLADGLRRILFRYVRVGDLAAESLVATA